MSIPAARAMGKNRFLRHEGCQFCKSQSGSGEAEDPTDPFVATVSK